jgi:hypothetical protein
VTVRGLRRFDRRLELCGGDREKLRPIHIADNDGALTIQDGFHRYGAKGRKTILARVIVFRKPDGVAGMSSSNLALTTL